MKRVWLLAAYGVLGIPVAACASNGHLSEQDSGADVRTLDVGIPEAGVDEFVAPGGEAGSDRTMPGTAGDDASDTGPDSPPCSNACNANQTRCAPGGVQTCDVQSNGCAQWVTTAPCGTHQTCGSPAGTASCTCNPTICAQPGAVCQDAQTVATCAVDKDGCDYVASTAPCASPKSCAGSAPTAACSLTCTSTCTQGQASCVSGGLATCTQGANGCWSYAAPVACGTHQTCTGTAGAAQCTCNVSSVCTAVGPVCVNSVTTASCTKDAQGCFYEALPTNCSASTTCLTASGSCGGACGPTQTQCSGNTVQTCGSAGTWLNGQTCPYVCAAGACTGVCVPGATQCCDVTTSQCGATENASTDSETYADGGGTTTPADALQAQVCDATGQWTGVPCGGCGGVDVSTGYGGSSSHGFFACGTCNGAATCKIEQGGSFCVCP